MSEELKAAQARIAELEGALSWHEEQRNDMAEIRAELAAIKAQEPVVWRFKERAEDMRSAWLYVKKRGHVPNGHPWQGLYASPVSRPQLNLPDQDRYFEIVSGVFGKSLGQELAMKLALVTGTIHNEIISLNPTPAKPMEDL